MAKLSSAALSGTTQVIKNKIGQWIGWNGARATVLTLRRALGDDADSAINLLVSTGTAGEFGVAAAAQFLSDEMRGKFSPGQAWLLEAVLSQMSENIYPEFIEEINRIKNLHKTDKDAAKVDAGRVWNDMTERAFGAVNPSGETALLRYLSPLGGNTTYYALGFGTGSFDRQKAAFEAAGYTQHYIQIGTRPADTRSISTGHSGLVFFEGEVTIDEALADPNGQLCRADFPLIERALQASLKGSGSTGSAWGKLTADQRSALQKNEARLNDAVVKAEHRAEREGGKDADGNRVDLTPMEDFLSSHGDTIRDSANQMRVCTDFGLLRMVAEVKWPDDILPTATDEDKAKYDEEVRLALFEVYNAINRVGDQASADRRAEQAGGNLLRWAKVQARRTHDLTATVWGRVINHPVFIKVATVVSLVSILSAFVGMIIWFLNAITIDLAPLSHADDLTSVSSRAGWLMSAGVLMAQFAGVLYLASGIIGYFSKALGAVGRVASAIGRTVFKIEVAEVNAADLFDQGQFLKKLAAGYLAVVSLATLFSMGTLEVDLIFDAHEVARALRVLVPCFLFALALGKAGKDLARGLSASVNFEIEKIAISTLKNSQWPIIKIFVLLVFLVPLGLPIAHVTGALGVLSDYQNNSIEHVDATHVLMPNGKTELTTILGGKEKTAKVCSNGRVHVAMGRPVNTNAWKFNREWNGVLTAVFTGIELLKVWHDAHLKVDMLDGFTNVTLQSAFPGATQNRQGLVVVTDLSRSAEFMKGTPDEDFIVQSDGFVRVEQREVEEPVVSAARFSDFLAKTPGYAFWVLVAVFFFIIVFSLPSRELDAGGERTFRLAVAGGSVFSILAMVIAWFVRASIVG